MNELSDYFGAGLTSDVTQLVTNPYYLNLLLRDDSRFGKIVSSPAEAKSSNVHNRLPGRFQDYSLPERDLGADYTFGQVSGHWSRNAHAITNRHFAGGNGPVEQFGAERQVRCIRRQ